MTARPPAEAATRSIAPLRPAQRRATFPELTPDRIRAKVDALDSRAATGEAMPLPKLAV